MRIRVGLYQFGDEDLAVADGTGARRSDDRLHRGIHQFVGHRRFDLRLRYEVHRVFSTPVEFRVSLLATKTLDLGHGHPLNARFGERLADILELEGLDH